MAIELDVQPSAASIGVARIPFESTRSFDSLEVPFTQGYYAYLTASPVLRRFGPGLVTGDDGEVWFRPNCFRIHQVLCVFEVGSTRSLLSSDLMSRMYNGRQALSLADD